MGQIANFIEQLWDEEETEHDKALVLAFSAMFFLMLAVDLWRG